MSEALIQIDLDLPDHSKELEDVDEYIKLLKSRLADYKRTRLAKPMSLKEYTAMYDQILRGLYYLGSLSLPAFATEDIIEEKYFKTYKHAPELAKKLWWDHYESVHRPYTLFKNRLFKMIDDLTALYMLIHKCPPPDYVE